MYLTLCSPQASSHGAGLVRASNQAHISHPARNRIEDKVRRGTVAGHKPARLQEPMLASAHHAAKWAVGSAKSSGELEHEHRMLRPGDHRSG